jgi:hypothetical protein
MYKYKQVKKVSTEKLLRNKAGYLKKISYIDEELEKAKIGRNSIRGETRRRKENEKCKCRF